MKREQIIGLCVLLLLTMGAVLGDPGPSAGEDALSDGERSYQELLEAAPLAKVEGEAVSPDGRFLVRAEGETDLYVSGVPVPGKIQVVDSGTGEALWETEGMVAQQALWSPEGGYLALEEAVRQPEWEYMDKEELL